MEGRKAKAALETARQKLATLCNVKADAVLFTGSATESNNLILSGSRPKTLILNRAEHDSVVAPAEKTRGTGKTTEFLPLTEDGAVPLDLLEEALKKTPAEEGLVSIASVNHETGVIRDLEAISALTRQYGALLHTDAVQAVGKVPLLEIAPFADIITLSGHKVGGLRGASAIIAKNGIEFTPLLIGGGQEKRKRAGTESLSAIVALSVLFTEIYQENGDFTPDCQAEIERVRHLRDEAENAALALCPDAFVIAQEARRAHNVFYLVTPGVKSETQVIIADLAGASVSAGAACSSGKVKASETLLAFGYPQAVAECGLRVSFGFRNTTEDVDIFIKAYKKILTARA